MAVDEKSKSRIAEKKKEGSKGSSEVCRLRWQTEIKYEAL